MNKQKTYSKALKQELQNEYIKGKQLKPNLVKNITYRQLANTYQVSYETIIRFAKKDWINNTDRSWYNIKLLYQKQLLSSGIEILFNKRTVRTLKQLVQYYHKNQFNVQNDQLLNNETFQDYQSECQTINQEFVSTKTEKINTLEEDLEEDRLPQLPLEEVSNDSDQIETEVELVESQSHTLRQGDAVQDLLMSDFLLEFADAYESARIGLALNRQAFKHMKSKIAKKLYDIQALYGETLSKRLLNDRMVDAFMDNYSVTEAKKMLDMNDRAIDTIKKIKEMLGSGLNANVINQPNELKEVKMSKEQVDQELRVVKDLLDQLDI